MSISFISVPGSGKSTTVGILFQAIEKYSIGKDITIFVPKRYTDIIYNDIRDPMIRGYWPLKTELYDDDKIQFIIGFKPKGKFLIKMIPRLARQKISHSNRFGDLLGFVFTINNVPTEDILKENGNHRLFDCNVPIFIIDSSKFTYDKKGTRFDERKMYDIKLSNVMRYYDRYINCYEPDNLIPPIMIFTKIDMIEGKINKDFNIDRNFVNNTEYDEKIANTTGIKLMKKFLPAFWKEFSKLENNFINITSFFSWIGTRKLEEIDHLDSELQVSVDMGFPSNVFPSYQYYALIDHLNKLSLEGFSSYPDDIDSMLNDI